MTNNKTEEPQSGPVTTTATIDVASLDAECAGKVIRPLLAENDRKVRVVLKDDGHISNEYVDALFGALMRSAMATGGRKLAAEWSSRLDVPGDAGERAHCAMAETIDLDLRFGMLAAPLAAQAGCETDVLQHEQHDADCIARLAVHGIATESEVHKMRRRLVKRIVEAVMNDTRPQTVGTNRPRESARKPQDAGRRAAPR